MASFEIVQANKRSINIYVYVDDYEERLKYRIFCREDDGEEAIVDTTKSSKTDFAYTIRGLERGVKYAINVGLVVYDEEAGHDVTYWAGKQTATTIWMTAPSARVLSVDGSTIYIRISNWDSDSETFLVRANGYFKADGSVDEDASKVELSFDRFNYTYDIEVYTYDEDNHRSEPYEFEATTGPLKKWTWSSTEKRAFNNHGNASTLTATRWKNFCTYINGLSNAAKNARISSKAYTIDLSYFNDIRSGDKMEVDSFREAFWVLNYICDQADVEYDYPGSDNLQTGKIIYGHYFIDAEDAIGEIVDLINEE